MDWIYELPASVPRFLNQLKSDQHPGFFHYSLSGDIPEHNSSWGLGQTVFATKILHILDLLDNLPDDQHRDLTNFINGFKHSDHTIFDPLIKRRAWLTEKIQAFTSTRFNNFFHQLVISAETRQSMNALHLLNQPAVSPTKFVPATTAHIDKFLSSLDWSKPWAAGSHFSHLMFFLQHSRQTNSQPLIRHATSWLNNIERADGTWHTGHPNTQHRINGAMKVITGLRAANLKPLSQPQSLIDLALQVPTADDACSNFNSIYVLADASRALPNYRAADIKRFAQQRLAIYRQHYWPKLGGFSFFPRHANTHYYGAKITRGLAEPDIHGTIMFLWGVSLIRQLLDLNHQLKFNQLDS